MTGTKASELGAITPPFADRLAGKRLELDGIGYLIKPLHQVVDTYIQGASLDEAGDFDYGLRVLNTIAFGVVECDGLELTWRGVSLLGKVFQRLTADSFALIKPAHVGAIYAAIIELSNFAEDEQRRLDFTGPGDGNTPVSQE